MKLKTILMTGILGLAMGTMAQAWTGTIVRLTGSTAYKNSTHAGIIHSFDTGTCKAGGSGNDYIFTGTINSKNVAVVCHWSGSEQALLSLAKPTDAGASLNFINTSIIDESSVTSKLVAVTVPTGTVTDASGVYDVNKSVTIPALRTLVAGDYTSAVPDAGMSDTYQGASLYRTNSSKGYNALYSANPNVDADGIVGVVVFKWLASPGTKVGQGVTNMTSQNARNLIPAGTLAGSFMNPTASGTAYLVGRDSMSGTRLTTFAETGYGAVKGAAQYAPGKTTTAVTDINDANLVKAISTPIKSLGLLTDGTAGGYGSGGDLCKAISNTLDASLAGKFLIGYAGTADSDSSSQGILNGAEELAYNGVALGKYTGSTFNYNDWSLVRNGVYTFWGYEHMYTTKTLNDAKVSDSGSSLDNSNYQKQQAIQTICDQIANGTLTNSVPDALVPYMYGVNAAPGMNVSRTSDGGTVQ